MTDWTKHPVTCSACGAQLVRRLFRPKDGAAIANFFCDQVCKGKWQRDAKPVTRDWLHQRYVIEGLSANQIAREVGRNPKQVWQWLKGYGIRTRGRGHNFPDNFRPRTPGFRLTDAQKAQLRAARIRDGHYPKNGNGDAYWKGVRGESHPAWRGGATPERQSFYASAEWAAARTRTYARAGGKCERCGSGRRLHIHHVIPFAFKSVRACPANLRVLCLKCHHFVHGPQNVDREYLPPFGVMYLNGRPIPINYRPKVRMEIPQWL